MSRPRSASSVLRRLGALGLLLALSAAPLLAQVNRSIMAGVPRKVAPDTEFSLPIVVTTNAGGGERIGFFHGEYSTDDGKSWTGFCFESNLTPAATRTAHVRTGAAGSTVIVRVRIAFRDGPAGDVDYTGAAIKWQDSWETWGEPPAKYFRIAVAQ